MRQCRTCREVKSLSDFQKDKQRKDGIASRCKVCTRKYMRKWINAHKDHYIATQRAYQRNNRDKINAQVRARTDYKHYYERNGRKCHYKKKYGITVEEYDRLFRLQDGACAICRSQHPGSGKKHFHVDHDHLTGKVRGLLCVKCNLGIGSFDDSTSLLYAAAVYIMEGREGSDPNDYEA